MSTQDGSPSRRPIGSAGASAALCCLWIPFSVVVLAACDPSVVAAEQALPVVVPSDAAAPDVASPDAAPPRPDGGHGGAPGNADGGVYVACGTARCRNVTASVSGTPVELYACCARPAESRCGLVTGTVCEELGQRGEIDPDCPTLPDTVIGTLPGCCRPEGMCGVFDTTYGFGCGQVPVISQLSPCKPKP